MPNEPPTRSSDKFAELRRRAEAVLAKTSGAGLSAPGMDAGINDASMADDVRHLISELQIHQIELEMQNEALRQTQSQLTVEREKYADLYNFAPVAYFTVDNNDVILDLNLAGAELIGQERKTLVERPITPYLTPESLQVFIQHRQQALQTHIPQTCELTLRRRDGTHAIVVVHTTTLQAENSSHVIWRSVMTDVTKRKQAEEKLYASEQRYRSLYKNNHAVMLLINPQTQQVVDANPAACAYYGYSPAELTALKITDINILNAEQVAEEMQKALREERRQFFFRHRLSSGEIREVEIYSGPIEVAGQHLLYSIIHDITERKRAEEALQRSLEEKEMLMKELQHRAKNSLNVIASLLELEKDNLPDERSQAIFTSVQSRIRSMSAIYEQLYRSGSLGHIDLSLYIQRLVDDLSKSYILYASVIIETNLEPIFLDLKRALPLGIILNELITNAIKYAFPAKTAGRIQIGLEKSGSEIKLCVADNGVGINPNQLEEAHSGLGLKLVEILATQINGRFVLQNEHGVTVQIIFGE